MAFECRLLGVVRLSIFGRFVFLESAISGRFVWDFSEIWICGLYIEPGTDISIYDTTGKCIKTFAVDGDSEIPLPSGIYLIKYAGRTVKIIL